MPSDPELELTSLEREAALLVGQLVAMGFDPVEVLELVAFPRWPGEE